MVRVSYCLLTLLKEFEHRHPVNADLRLWGFSWAGVYVPSRFAALALSLRVFFTVTLLSGSSLAGAGQFGRHAVGTWGYRDHTAEAVHSDTCARWRRRLVVVVSFRAVPPPFECLPISFPVAVYRRGKLIFVYSVIGDSGLNSNWRRGRVFW